MTIQKRYKVSRAIMIAGTLVGRIPPCPDDRIYIDHDGRKPVPKSAVGFVFRGGNPPPGEPGQSIWRFGRWPHGSTNPFEIVGYLCPSK